MNIQHSPESDALDELLTVLSSKYCRSVLSHFRECSEDVISVEDLAAAITEGGLADDKVITKLTHSHLPRLSDVGVIDFDARSNTVRYLGHADLEALLDSIQTATHQKTLKS